MGAQLVIWIAFLAAFFGAVFSSLHLALVDLSRATLETLAAHRARPDATRRIHEILNDLPGHARALSLPRLLCNLTVTVGLVWWILLLRSAPVAGAASDGLPVMRIAEAAIAIAVAAIILWIDSVVIPMSIASHAGERLVYTLSWLVRAVYIIESPLQPFVRFMDNTVRRLSGARPRNEQTELEAEILSVIHEGEREGSLDETAKEMIEAVVEFRSTTVEQIMTPRTEIVALEATDDIQSVLDFVRRDGHSRVPVYERDLDHILGILYAKDLLRVASVRGSQNAAATLAFRIRDILRPAVFVPETKTVRELLSELLSMRVHIALVADEFGGTSGLVTIEDIIEEVFGEISDEYETAKDAPPRITVDTDTRTADIDARASIRDVNHALAPLSVSLPVSDNYDTVAGYVMATLGRIPDEGDTFCHPPMAAATTDGAPAEPDPACPGVVITVTQATATRVMRVRVDAPAPPPAPSAPHSAADTPTDTSTPVVQNGQPPSDLPTTAPKSGAPKSGVVPKSAVIPRTASRPSVTHR